MQQWKISIIGLFLISLISCAKKFTSKNLPKEYIEIGSGGGFTGSYAFSRIAKNGQVFDFKSGDSAYRLVGTISKKIVKKTYKLLSSETKTAISKTGNMNYFLYLGTKDSTVTWLWSDGKKVNEKVMSAYKTLNELVIKIPNRNNLPADEQKGPIDHHDHNHDHNHDHH